MANRVYYAMQKAGIGPAAGTSFTAIHGLQSVGMTTSYTLEPIRSLGSLAIYDSLESAHEVKVTLKKVLDGSSSMYTMATGSSISTSLEDNAMAQCAFGMSIDGGAGLKCKNMYVDSAKFTFSADGIFEEELSLIGDSKTWDGVGILDVFNGDVPPYGGGVARREDFLMDESILPVAGNIYSVSVSVNIPRESINGLGNRSPYFRMPTFPIGVTTEITVIATGGDGTAAKEDDTCTITDNTGGTEIYIATCEGTAIYLGDKNKLIAVNQSGGDAGGGNMKITYTYQAWH